MSVENDIILNELDPNLNSEEKIEQKSPIFRGKQVLTKSKPSDKQRVHAQKAQREASIKQDGIFHNNEDVSALSKMLNLINSRHGKERCVKSSTLDSYHSKVSINFIFRIY